MADHIGLYCSYAWHGIYISPTGDMSSCCDQTVPGVNSSTHTIKQAYPRGTCFIKSVPREYTIKQAYSRGTNIFHIIDSTRIYYKTSTSVWNIQV